MGLWVAGPRNVELYDVIKFCNSRSALRMLEHIIVLCDSGIFFPTNLNVAKAIQLQSTVCDYCTEGCICDVIGMKNTPRIATKMSRGLFKCKALHV